MTPAEALQSRLALSLHVGKRLPELVKLNGGTSLVRLFKDRDFDAIICMAVQDLLLEMVPPDEPLLDRLAHLTDLWLTLDAQRELIDVYGDCLTHIVISLGFLAGELVEAASAYLEAT